MQNRDVAEGGDGVALVHTVYNVTHKKVHRALGSKHSHVGVAKVRIIGAVRAKGAARQKTHVCTFLERRWNPEDGAVGLINAEIQPRARASELDDPGFRGALHGRLVESKDVCWIAVDTDSCGKLVPQGDIRSCSCGSSSRFAVVVVLR